MVSYDTISRIICEEVIVIHVPLDEVEDFLKLVKVKIMGGNRDILKYRRNFLETKALLGITDDNEIYDEIKKLSPSDYVETVEDYDYPNEYCWVFKKVIYNQLIYIKLKIKTHDNNQLLVMSFHIDI